MNVRETPTSAKNLSMMLILEKSNYEGYLSLISIFPTLIPLKCVKTPRKFYSHLF